LCERGDELVLGVELCAGAGGCPRCASTSIELKERVLVRVRDLAIGARRTTLVWRKRRYRCRGCRRSFSETHPELPSRQRVSARFRRELFRYVRGGAAHLEVARLEQTSRYQVVRAFQLGSEEARSRSGLGRWRGGWRSTRPRTGAARSDS